MSRLLLTNDGWLFQLAPMHDWLSSVNACIAFVLDVRTLLRALIFPFSSFSLLNAAYDFTVLFFISLSLPPNLVTVYSKYINTYYTFPRQLVIKFCVFYLNQAHSKYSFISLIFSYPNFIGALLLAFNVIVTFSSIDL